MKIFKEKPGVISEGPCWVCFHGPYMYTGDSFWLLLKDLWRNWNNDRALVG